MEEEALLGSLRTNGGTELVYEGISNHCSGPTLLLQLGKYGIILLGIIACIIFSIRIFRRYKGKKRLRLKILLLDLGIFFISWFISSIVYRLLETNCVTVIVS